MKEDVDDKKIICVNRNIIRWVTLVTYKETIFLINIFTMPCLMAYIKFSCIFFVDDVIFLSLLELKVKARLESQTKMGFFVKHHMRLTQ